MALFGRNFSKSIDDWSKELVHQSPMRRRCYRCAGVIDVMVDEYYHEGGAKARFSLTSGCGSCGSRYEFVVLEDPIYSQKFHVSSCKYETDNE